MISSLLNWLFKAYINERVQLRGVLNSWLNEFNSDCWNLDLLVINFNFSLFVMFSMIKRKTGLIEYVGIAISYIFIDKCLCFYSLGLTSYVTWYFWMFRDSELIVIFSFILFLDLKSFIISCRKGRRIESLFYTGIVLSFGKRSESQNCFLSDVVRLFIYFD